MLSNLKNVQRLAASVLTLVLAAAISVVGVARLNAQAATGSIQGTVTDASGSAVPDAMVQVKNTGTGATQNVTSNAQGRFVAADLAVGAYELRFTRMGFQTVVRTGITLTVGAQAVVDVSLPVGQQQQTVTVEAQASQVETTNSSVGQLTDQRQMTELPLNGRGFEQLIELAPGVNTMAQGSGAYISFGMQGRAPEYSIAGSRPVGQQILLDDESLENFWGKGISSVLGSSLGVEAIGEFQTLTNTYSAQFGGNGGVINAVSKNGTNAFHGSAYEFLRNSDLDARTFIDPSVIPAFRQNQFGGTLGGPIKKDKMFFFVNYEGVQLVQGESRIGPVPGCNEPGVNCTVTATNPSVAAAVKNVLAIFPNATSIVNGQPEVLTSASRSAHENYVLGRWDYNISDKDSIFVRYTSDKSQYVEPYGGGGFGGSSVLPYWPEEDYEHTQFVTTEWRRLISPTLVNVARVAFSRPSENEYTGKTNPLGLVNGVDPLQFFPGSGRQDGGVAITGMTALGGAYQLPFNTTPNKFTEGDDVIWTHGSHNVRMGATIVRDDTNTFMPFFQGGNFSFTSLGAFLSGNLASLLYVPLTGYPNRDYRDITFTPYVQDDWKVNKKLTINFGLRWEFATNPVDQHNELYYVTDVATAVAPYYTHVSHAIATNPNWQNFDPRLGFAYDPFADHKTSIRGGFGIFHEPITPLDYTAGYWACAPWGEDVALGVSAVGPVLGVAFPNIPGPGSLNVAKPNCSPGWDYNSKSTPYNMQYNLNIQREITPGTILTVAYTGSRGLHGFTEQEANPTLLCSVAQGPGCANPTAAYGSVAGYFGYGTPGNVTANSALNNNLSTFPNVNPEATSRYNALQITLNRRFSRNLQFGMSYNWQSCISDGGWLGSFNGNGQSEFMDPYNLTIDKARCSFDQKQVFKTTGLYALPFKGNRFVEGWQISTVLTANSGLPLNITDGYDESTGISNGPLNLDRPNYVAGCQIQVGHVNEWYNPACFNISAPGTLGNLGSDVVTGPGFLDLDLAVLKDTKINERVRLQLRGEFFNIINRTNYGLPAAALYVAGGTTTGGNLATYTGLNLTAGQITSQAATPRQIQFALKLIF